MLSVTHLKAYILFLDFSHWQKKTTEDSCQHTWKRSHHKETLKQGISSYLQIVWRRRIPSWFCKQHISTHEAEERNSLDIFPHCCRRQKSIGLLPATITHWTSMEIRPAVYIKPEINYSPPILFGFDKFQPLLLAKMHRSWFCELLCSNRLLRQPGAR